MLLLVHERFFALSGNNGMKYQSNTSGFTLIEVLVALVIVTSAIMGAMVIFHNGLLTAEKIRQNNRLAKTAVVAMERIRMTDLSEIPEGKGKFYKLHYTWEAKEIMKSPVRIFKTDKKSGNKMMPTYHVILYKVVIKVWEGERGNQYLYYHLGWVKKSRKFTE